MLFGGAKSISELFNDTLVYFIKEKSWLKLEPTGEIPSPRAAHAACLKEGSGVVVFGGAKKNGGFSSNELYLLELGSKSETRWVVIPCRDPKPSRRYGHIMLYSKPYLILSGGVLKEKNKLANDLWIVNLSKKVILNEEKEYYVYQWTSVECTNFPPSPRMYHTAGIIKSGRAKGMILIFGGRGEKNQPQSDTWGLRKHRDGSWEWIAAPCLGNLPRGRYQHTAIFFTNNMVILGGLGETDKIGNEAMAVEIYNCDTFEWSAHFSFNKFRHSSFLIEKYAFTFGGCEYSEPLKSTDKIVMFDVQELCNNVRR